jgi:hypothetical protein
MATCPKGHESTAIDYCDECGAAIGGAEAATPTVIPAGTGEQHCPECATARAGRFCEVCGHDFVAAQLGERPPAGASPTTEPEPTGASVLPPAEPEPTGASVFPAAGAPAGEGGAPAGTGWRVVVTADRAYYDRMRAAADPDAAEVAFPAYCPQRRFALQSPHVLIGRQSRSRGIEPDIDLTGPPADPAVSHSHAILVSQPGGGWAVVDLGSANGTYVNDNATPIESNQPVPVADGDRVHVGAWSTLTLHAT